MFNLDLKDRKTWSLTPAERQRAQRYVILGNSFANTATFICAGAMMQVFANDVLGYSPKRIATILAVAPMVGILRIPLLGPVRRFGLKRTLLASLMVRLGVILVLLFLPASALTFPLYLGLLMTFVGGQQLGAITVWQPMLRDLTTTADRGSFFATMRFWFSSMTALVSLLVAVIVGQEITEMQYKLLLVIAALGALNQIFWLRLIPTRSQESGDGEGEGASFWVVLRSSRLLRLPLLIILLLALINMPIFVIYLRRMLLVPSNMVSLYVLCVTVGGALSYLLWGRVADTVGFRPMLIGLLALCVFVQPVLLLPMRPLTPMAAELSAFTETDWLTLVLLGVFGLFNGALVAGMGIANTSIQHFHVRHRDSLPAMNIVSLCSFVVIALVALLGGKLLEDLAMPRGTMPFAGGVFHFDWMKGYLCIAVPIIALVTILLARRLPNARPYFGVGDFFTSILYGPVRTIAAQRHLYHEDEGRREELARWLGWQKNPMVIDPLLELLGDPEYDVKVEAIRSLARTGSPVAGEALLRLFEDPRSEHLSDHLAWALGELKFAPAYEALIDRFTHSSSARVRAMSARALGKVGNAAASGPLAELLACSDEENLQVIASCCRALLRLEAYSAAPVVFASLERLTSREEYYELLNVLCGWLLIPNGWLLRSTTKISISEMLNEEINRRSALWQRSHAPVIEAFRERDQEGIRQTLQHYLETHHDAVGATLAEVMAKEPRWGPETVLATAWLLFRR